MDGELESEELHAANQATVCTLSVDDAGEVVQPCPRRRSIGRAFVEDRVLPALRSGRAAVSEKVSELQDWWNRTEFWSQAERDLGQDVKDDAGAIGQFFAPITAYKTIMRRAEKELVDPPPESP